MMEIYSQGKLQDLALNGEPLTSDIWLTEGMTIFTIARYRDGKWKLMMEETIFEPNDDDIANGYDEVDFDSDDDAKTFGLVSVTPSGDRSEILPEDQLKAILLEPVQTQNQNYEAGEAGFQEYVIYQRGVVF